MSFSRAESLRTRAAKVKDVQSIDSPTTKRARTNTSASSQAPPKKIKPTPKTNGDVKSSNAEASAGNAATPSATVAEDSKGAKKSNTSSSLGKNYWLMKAEQEDREVQAKNGSIINAKFTIDDLEAKSEPEPWDGVRNVVARNNMRSMKVGDLAFFYASGGKGSVKPGISGIMKIVKEHEPDWTVSDEGAYGYMEPKDRGSEDAPKWSLVHVEFVQKLDTMVPLAELKSHSQPGDPLANMQLLRNGRISVSRVSQEEWDFIMIKLVKGA